MDFIDQVSKRLAEDKYDKEWQCLLNEFRYTRILIDGGGMFDGNIIQFANSFFSNPTKENIIDWCEEIGYTYEFVVEEEPLYE